jgi:hypothetical protein
LVPSGVMKDIVALAPQDKDGSHEGSGFGQEDV